MRSLLHRLLWCLLCGVTPSFADSQIYRYTDDAGTLNFTNDLQTIPREHRTRAVPLYTEITATAGAVSPMPPPPQAEPVTRVVTISSDYRMGAHDSRTDAMRMAIESAKRQAIEQVATYLESVTEVRNLDVTRDEIRSYTGGVVMVLNQQTSTRTENGAVIIHVDLTAQVDRNEVVRAITALREHESAKHELVALRTETDQLRRQLDAANQALATAQSPERIEALTAERRQVMNQMQAHALVSQVWTESIYAPILYAYPGLAFRQANGLLLQARQLHPTNRHLHAAQQALAARAGGFPPPAPGETLPVPPRTSLLVPQPPPDGQYPQEAATVQPGLPAPSPLAAPFLTPTFPQIQPQGVPHGSLHHTPAPAFPQNPLRGVPDGSFPQGRAIPTFPQIQPQGVPHGSLHQNPGSGAAERFSGGLQRR